MMLIFIIIAKFNHHHQQHDKCRLPCNHHYAYHHHRQHKQKHQRQQQPKLSRCVKSQIKQRLFNVFTCFYLTIAFHLFVYNFKFQLFFFHV